MQFWSSVWQLLLVISCIKGQLLPVPDSCDGGENGPHSDQCLTDVWTQSGCLSVSDSSPSNTHGYHKTTLSVNNNINTYMSTVEGYNTSAAGGNTFDQLKCWGFALPTTCQSPYSGHSLECMMELWNTGGCSVNGTFSPGNAATSVYQTYTSTVLKVLQDLFHQYFTDATVVSNNADEDALKQTKCFGKSYPYACLTINAPTTEDCRIAIWAEEGCKSAGSHYPTSSYSGNEILETLTVQKLQGHYHNYYVSAYAGNEDYQTNCLGQVYGAIPSNCTFLSPPLTAECINALWIQEGCVGNYYPNFESDMGNLNNLEISDLKTTFQTIINAASGGDVTSQQKCHGPNSICEDITGTNVDKFCDQFLFLGSTCGIMCTNGYILLGGAVTECKKIEGNFMPSWSPLPAVCVASDFSGATTCGVLNDVLPNGEVSCTDSNNYGSQCTFSCSEGYSLVGESSTTCIFQSDEEVVQWFPQDIPICQAIVCPSEQFSGIPYSLTVSCTNVYNAGSTCTYFCAPDYQLSAEIEITCLNSGIWSNMEAPECFGPLGGKTACTGLIGESITCTDTNKYGSECSFVCTGGTVLVGVSPITCIFQSEELQWSADIPECQTIPCPSEPLLGLASPLDISCPNGYYAGSTCTYECAPGYQMSAVVEITCLNSGQWNDLETVPECFSSPCISFGSIGFGDEAACTNHNFPGSVCTLQCPISSDVRAYECTAQDGGFWNDTVLPCLGCENGLLDVMFLIDGSMNTSPTEFIWITSWMSSVFDSLESYIDKGLLWIGLTQFGFKSSSCDNGSSHNIEIPVQKNPVSNLKLKLENITRNGGCSKLGDGIYHAATQLHAKGRKQMRNVLVIVTKNFTEDDFVVALNLVNSTNARIIAIGVNVETNQLQKLTNESEQTFSVPRAENLVEMDVVDTILKSDCAIRGGGGDTRKCNMETDNGSWICKETEEFPYNCMIQCDSGYQPVGHLEATCDIVKGYVRWITERAICKEVLCEALAPPSNGHMRCTHDIQIGSKCHFTCNVGFILLGRLSVSCGDPMFTGTGMWNGKVPQCSNDAKCFPILTTLKNGVVKCSAENHFGSECRFLCNDGFVLSNSGIAKCGTHFIGGMPMWSSTEAKCKRCEYKTCSSDILLVLDGSRSIGEKNFMSAKELSIEILGQFKGVIDQGNAHVGVLQYGGEVQFQCYGGDVDPMYKVELDMGKYDFAEIESRIMNISAVGGCARTADAIQQANVHFDMSGRSLDVAEHVIVLLTDGKSNQNVEPAVEEAGLKGVVILSAPIGDYDAIQMKKLNGRLSHVFDVQMLNDAEDVGELVQTVNAVDIGLQFEDNTEDGSRGFSVKSDTLLVFIMIGIILL